MTPIKIHLAKQLSQLTGVSIKWHDAHNGQIIYKDKAITPTLSVELLFIITAALNKLKE